MAIADTILRQLGGANRLKAAIGAKQFFSDNDGRTLVFKFPNRQRSKPNYVKITLTCMDDYEIEFGRAGNKKDKALGIMLPVYKKLRTLEGIYCDQLVPIFESETGLILTLFPRR